MEIKSHNAIIFTPAKIFVIALLLLIASCSGGNGKTPAPDIQTAGNLSATTTNSAQTAQNANNNETTSCQKSGGMECKGCCKIPISSSSVSDSNSICCSPNSCIGRIQAQYTFEILGDSTIERFPNGNYGVWYGEIDTNFGNRRFVDAQNTGGNNYRFVVDAREYVFYATESSCEISIGKPPVTTDNREYNFVFVPTDNSWKDQLSFEEKAKPDAIFFGDISEFKFKNTKFIYIPLEFANSRCEVANIATEPVKAKRFQNVKDCADLYSSSIGVGYERAIGFSNLNYQGAASFGYKTAYLAINYAPNRIMDVAHEFGHTYYLCDEYDYTLYAKQDKDLARIIGGCINKWPVECPKAEHCDGSSCTSTGLCLGNMPTYRDYSGIPLAGNYCKGTTHYSVMGDPAGRECGYDSTGGYAAVGPKEK